MVELRYMCKLNGLAPVMSRGKFKTPPSIHLVHHLLFLVLPSPVPISSSP